MRRTSIATVCLSGPLEEKLQAIGRAGFDAVEIFETDFLTNPAGPAEVRRLVEDAGLTIAVFQPFRDFEGLPEPLRSRAFDRAERKFDLMQALGAELMLVCSSVAPAALGGVDRAAGDFHALGERAAARGLRIGYEALAWGRHVFDHRDAWEIVRRADHPAVGLVLDSFHTLARRIDPDSIRRIPGDRIFLVQVADAPLLDMDYLSWSRHFRTMPGQGALDVPGFLAAVAATGYDGYLSLEVFNDQFRAGSARQVAIDGRRSLIAALDQLRLGQPLPPRAAPLGVEFVEFAVDEAGAEELGRLFAGLGFRHAGRHVTKEVDWWRQGAINLVINRERESFAQAFWHMHGPGVCALGLRMPDAKAALARAEALLAEPFRQPVPVGQLTLPAIRGVGGSLLTFTDETSELARVWQIEFKPDAPQEAAPATLVAVDHVVQSLGYGELLSWLLFYGALFAMERRPLQEIADPGGLISSQVVETADGAVRIALNVSESGRTLPGRFLSEFFGAGVQHIAFASADIFASAAQLETAGVPRLPIPENYYDDLDARFGLAPDFVGRLRAHALLYDRDEGGEYLQLYTLPFAQRFFFEIVERRGGYRGFGAANAPVRLAMQARLAGPVL
jgi:4-hydroxyphenylpyruvate dioxygenase